MTPVTRYFCPLDCGWHHDQGAPDFADLDRPYPVADTLVPTGLDQIAFRLAAGELMAIEATVKQHLETHELLDWVRAIGQAKAGRDRSRSALHDAEAQRDSVVVTEATGTYLIDWQVASAALYNTVLQRATNAEAAVERVQALCAEYAEGEARGLIPRGSNFVSWVRDAATLPDDPHVCRPGAGLYYCPTAGGVESSCHGGFDVCCAHPELHRPVEERTTPNNLPASGDTANNPTRRDLP